MSDSGINNSKTPEDSAAAVENNNDDPHVPSSPSGNSTAEGQHHQRRRSSDGRTAAAAAAAAAVGGLEQAGIKSDPEQATTTPPASEAAADFHDQKAPDRKSSGSGAASSPTGSSGSHHRERHSKRGKGTGYEGGAAGVEADLALSAEEADRAKAARQRCERLSKKRDRLAQKKDEADEAAAAAAAAAATAAAVDANMKEYEQVGDIAAWRDEKVAGVPWIFRLVYRHFVNAVRPDDSFDVAVRKMLLASMLLVLPFPVGFGIYWIVIAVTTEVLNDHEHVVSTSDHDSTSIDEASRISLIVAGSVSMLLVVTIIVTNVINRCVYHIADEELTAARALLLEDDGDIEMFDERYKRRQYLARQQRQLQQEARRAAINAAEWAAQLAANKSMLENRAKSIAAAGGGTAAEVGNDVLVASSKSPEGIEKQQQQQGKGTVTTATAGANNSASSSQSSTASGSAPSQQPTTATTESKYRVASPTGGGSAPAPGSSSNNSASAAGQPAALTADALRRNTLLAAQRSSAQQQEPQQHPTTPGAIPIAPVVDSPLGQGAADADPERSALDKAHARAIASPAAYPFWLTDLVITVAIIFVCVLAVAIPHFPVPTNMLAVVQMSVVVRSDWFGLHATLASIGFLIATYNMTFLNYDDWPLLTISEYHGAPGENLLLTLQGWVAILMTSYSLYVHYSEFLRLVHKSSTTTQMGSSVANHLRHWDLKGVERALTSYQALPYSDNFLHTQFSNIVQTIRDLSVYLPRDIISALVRNGESLRDCKLRMHEVTLVWVEMANFPALCDSLPCDELAKLLRWFHEAMARAVRQHDGVVVRLAGNMLCGMWNAPQKHENAASRACMAALHMLCIVQDLLVARFEEEGFGLQVRVGVHSGTAMVGPLGSNERAYFTANGGAVHFSAAMAKFGKRMRRSSIMVSDGTLRDANADLAKLGREGARFVSREGAEARSARHTTTTTVHQLVGISPETAVALAPEISAAAASEDGERAQQKQAAQGWSSSGAVESESGSTIGGSAASSAKQQQRQQHASVIASSDLAADESHNDSSSSQQQQSAPTAVVSTTTESPGGTSPTDSALDGPHPSSASTGESSNSNNSRVVRPPLFTPEIVNGLCCVDPPAQQILQAMDVARRHFDQREFGAAMAAYRSIYSMYDPNLSGAGSTESESLSTGQIGSGGGSRDSRDEEQVSSETVSPPNEQESSSSSSSSTIERPNASSNAAVAAGGLGPWPGVLKLHGIDEQLVDGLLKAAERLAAAPNRSTARFDPVVVFYDE